MIGNRAAVSQYASANMENAMLCQNSNAVRIVITAVTLDVLALSLPFWILA
jgi:hypothetical protein